MKKTSILLTVLLVVSLLFAVSCPNKDPSINVTSETSVIEKNLQDVDKNISIGVTIDLANDTFSDKVATAANVIDWFTLSDGTEVEKATLTSATVSFVSEKKDSVTVSIVAEAKVVTEENKPIKLIVGIPEATADAVWTTSKKAIKETNANSIAITIVNNGDTPTPPASKKVTGNVSDETIEFTESTVSMDKKSFKITLENGEFVNENDVVITGNGVTSGHISFAKTIDSNNKKVLNVSVSATVEVATSDGGDYTITVNAGAIKASSSDYTIEPLTFHKEVTVKKNENALDISFEIDGADALGEKTYIITLGDPILEVGSSYMLNNASFVSEDKLKKLITFTKKDGTSGASYAIDSNSFVITKNVPDIDEYLTVRFSTSTDYVSTASDLGDYYMYFPKECFVPNENYKVSEDGYKFTFHFLQYTPNL